jgi:hypothetical protein
MNQDSLQQLFDTFINVPERTLDEWVWPDLDGHGIPGTQMRASGTPPAPALVYGCELFHDRDSTKPAKAFLDTGPTTFAPVLANNDMNSRDTGVSYHQVLGHLWNAMVEYTQLAIVRHDLTNCPMTDQ